MEVIPELPGVRHEFVDAGGLRTHVALAGDEHAPPVLLVHGWPQNWWAWRSVIPALAERFFVVAPDLRGHGWTEAPPAGYEKEQLAGDLLALLDALGLEQVTWVGHDWGGWVGFLTALRAPARLERMVAVAIPHPWADPNLTQVGTVVSYQVPISLPMLGPTVADRFVRRLLQVGRGGNRLTDEEVEVYARGIPAHVTVAMYRTYLTRELVPIVRGRYAREMLQVPTTVLVGEDDLITAGSRTGPVAGQRDLKVEVLSGVAHWIPEQRPEAIVDQLAPQAHD